MHALALLGWLEPAWWGLIGFHIFILGMLALDLGLFHRQARAVGFAEAAVWSAVWVGLALAFTLGIWKFWHFWFPGEADQGGRRALEFLTGYLVEKSLSVDNLFVFLVIFRYFGVPQHLQHRVLTWGIVGALVLRAALILVGAALVSAFHWVLYLFGAFLLYTSYKLYFSVQQEIDPGRNPLLRLARRFLRFVDDYDSPRFWVRRHGRWHATPLPLVLLVVETTDIVFAIDSIPAIFGITSHAFLVYSSNVFAILGLRALYFLLAGFLGRFRYLHVGLALVLGFVGLKMLAGDWLVRWLQPYGVDDWHLLVVSLAVVVLILVAAIAASIVAGRRDSRNAVVPGEIGTAVVPGAAEDPAGDSPERPGG